MVDAVVPQQELAVSEAPRTTIDASVFQRNPRVDQGLEQLGAGTEDLATDLAKQQGQQDVQKAVTLDANGQPQLATPQNSIILGRAGNAYEAVVQNGTVAANRAVVTNQLNDAHAANPTDAAAFDQQASGIIAGLRQSKSLDPAVANALADDAQNIAAQHSANIRERSMSLDVSQTKQGIETDLADTQNKMSALARQGGMNTPEFDQLQDRLQDGYQALADNKLYGYSPEKADSDLTSAMDGFKADYVVGQVDQTFTKKGKAEAQSVLTNEILNNPDLNLSDSERKQYYAWGMSRLQYLTGEQKAQVDAFKDTKDGTLKILREQPGQLSDAAFGQIINQARSIGDSEGASQLSAAYAVSKMQRNTSGLTNEQSFNLLSGGAPSGGGSEQQAMQFFQSKGWSPAQAAGIVGNLVHESGLNTGATAKGDGSDGSDSIGLAQWNSQRAQQLKAFAASQGKQPTDFQTQLQFVQHELETSESGAAQRLRGATTPQDAAAAVALGYERPQGFMTGDMTQVAGGASRVANAVRLAGGGASSNVVATSANGIPFSDAAMKANPFLASEYIRSIATDGANIDHLGKSIGDGLETQIKGGIAPDPTTLANYRQLALAHPEKFGEQSQRIETSLTAQNDLAAAGGSGTVAGQKVLDQADYLARTQPSIAHQMYADAAHAAWNRQAENLKKEPLDEGARRNWLARPVTPLDFSPPQDGQQSTVPQAIADRGQGATAISSRTGGAVMPLGQNDLKNFQQSMPLADPGTVSTTLSALNSLPPAQLDQLTANDTFKQTIMGLAHSGDPAKMNAAFSFLDSQYRRNPMQFDASDPGAVKDLRTWQTLGSFLPPDEVAKKMATASDPNVIKAKDELGKTADQNLKSINPGNVVSSIYGTQVPLIGTLPFTSPGAIASDQPAVANGALMADYRAAYTDMFKETGDATAADQFAKEKLANKYSVSPLNGGRVMAYAPDRETTPGGPGAYYPKVNGSFDWLHDQLRVDVQQSDTFKNLRFSGDTAETTRIAHGLDYALQPDTKTQADIAANRPPSYKVIMVSPNDGRYHLIESSPGVPMRFRGDPTDAQAKAAGAFTARRTNDQAVENDTFEPMGSGS